jgi:transposase
MGKGARTEQVVREIHRRTRRRFSAEEKVRIVLEGLRGEESVAELCRREGLAPNLYYRWSKEFLEAGKKRLLGDTTREATAPEVKGAAGGEYAAQAGAGRDGVGESAAKKRLTGSGSEDDTCG